MAALQAVRPGVVAATLATNLLALALPMVLLQAYDRIIPNQATATLTALIVGLIVALLLDALVRIVRSSLQAWATARFEHRTSCALARRMLGAPIEVFERSPVGQRLERFAAIDTVREFYGGQAAQNVVDLPFMLLFLALIALIGGHLILVPVAVATLCALSIAVVGRRLNRALDARAGVDDRRYSFVVETLTGIETVKALALETLMIRRPSVTLSRWCSPPRRCRTAPTEPRRVVGEGDRERLGRVEPSAVASTVTVAGRFVIQQRHRRR
ncbi:MAG: ABC transporter transmembrane domain-containing protein [Alphaproteobacteria bacterium]